MTTKSEFDLPVLSTSTREIKKRILDKIQFTIGQDPANASQNDWLVATILATRDYMTRDRQKQFKKNTKQVCYLSMEFLIGRTLANALISTGIYDEVKTALSELNIDINEICESEKDPGLGNGGLGRLAACFLDSLATQSYNAWGYGLRYEHGIFKQKIVNNQQVEEADSWLRNDDPWQFNKNDVEYTVHLGGETRVEGDKATWINTDQVLASAYDLAVPGYGTNVTSTLRLWSSKTSNELDLNKFNEGDYLGANEKKANAELIVSILYPNDSTTKGKALRLCQEYFLVSATVQDIISRHCAQYGSIDNLEDMVSIHLNDTHPVLAVPELMRILIDDHKLSWDEAWNKTKKIFSYTNHTLMSEALETWSIDMMNKILPYHLYIIFKINYQFIEEVKQKFHHDDDLIRRVSVIDENNGRTVRMAWLAVIASHKINGVAALHSQLMVDGIFADFARIYPERFCNKTNGITPRRWLCVANPSLTKVIDKYLDKKWRTNLDMLQELNKQADSAIFLSEIKNAKLVNKQRLTKYVKDVLGITIDPNALFDMQIKRIHEYKRQGLSLLHTIVRYNEILKNPDGNWTPRVVFFAGKAASSYFIAKKLIELINEVANVINNDERIKGLLKLVFIPNYSVSIAEMMIPAADLSEQISLAGYEASGTSNMKFALNGSLIIGTEDGANVEIRDAVGAENIFIFGNTVDQVAEIRKNYSPRDIYENNPHLNVALTQISNGHFSPDDHERYRSLFDIMTTFGDFYQNLADFNSYYQTQQRVDELYRNQEKWNNCVAKNIANMGMFSSDRTIKEYADEIWNIKPMKL